jgi:25S rRNA (uracil2843-N3)-methyltransferase
MAPGAKAKDRRGQPKSTPSIESVLRSNHHSARSVTADLHQLLLNVFGNAFSSRFPPDASLIQQIKQHLYNRDFEKAFGCEEYLEAYATRWSSCRALGYANIFVDISEYLHYDSQRADSSSVAEAGAGNSSGDLNAQEEMSQSSARTDGTLNVVCLGGGAGAEIVGLAGFLHHLRASATPGLYPTKLKVTTVDVANWSTVVRALGVNVTTAPPLSKYASEKAKAANVPLVCGDDYSVTFYQCDILDADTDRLGSLVQESNLITLMFTLNELYTSSVPRTTKLLLSLGSLVRSGTLLLVVDSPGSYSTIELSNSGSSKDGTAKAEKRYPMHWLLDHTLVGTPSKDTLDCQQPRWRKLLSDNSRWFRLPDGLLYPIELENMRYQIHLYELA